MTDAKRPTPPAAKTGSGVVHALRAVVLNEAYHSGKRAALFGVSLVTHTLAAAYQSAKEIRTQRHRSAPAGDFEAYVKRHGLTESYLARRAALFATFKYIAYFLGLLGFTLATLSIGHEDGLKLVFYFTQSFCALVIGYTWGITTYQIRSRRLCSVGEAMRDINSYL